MLFILSQWMVVPRLSGTQLTALFRLFFSQQKCVFWSHKYSKLQWNEQNSQNIFANDEFLFPVFEQSFAKRHFYSNFQLCNLILHEISQTLKSVRLTDVFYIRCTAGSVPVWVSAFSFYCLAYQHFYITSIPKKFFEEMIDAYWFSLTYFALHRFSQRTHLQYIFRISLLLCDFYRWHFVAALI